jgi:hypothetical protein
MPVYRGADPTIRPRDVDRSMRTPTRDTVIRHRKVSRRLASVFSPEGPGSIV